MKTKINYIAKILSVVIIMAVAVIAGCSKNNSYSNPVSNPSGASPGPNEVWMQGMSFNPATKTVTAGTTITWINKDNYAHTVTSGVPGAPDGLFNSGNINSGGSFSYKFNTSGTIKYYCIIHSPMMTATMTVQ